MRSRWILGGIGIVLLLGAGVAAAVYVSHRRPVTTSSEAAYEAYQEATANEARFYFKEARLGFARALELDPTFAMAMLGLARQSPDQDQRTALVKRAAREKPRLTARERLHVDLQLAAVENRNADVLRIARELHAKFPDDVRSAEILAMEQMLAGNPDQAIRIFQDLLAVDPNNAQAYNQLGYQWGYRGEYDKAVDSLRKYQFIAADTANPFDSLAEVQANSGHYTEAIENLNHALAMKPDFTPAYWHLGVVYEGLGDPARAVANYLKAADFSDNDGARREYTALAIRAALIGNDPAAVRDAIARFQKIPRDPKDAKYAHIDDALLQAVLALAEGRPADAEKQLTAIRPAVEARWNEAYHEGKLLPTWKPHYPELDFLTAIALERQGRVDEALKYYESDANPPNPVQNFDQRRWIMEARSKVAQIVARKGDLDRAEKLLAENRKWNANWGPCRAAEAAVAELRQAKVLAATK